MKYPVTAILLLCFFIGSSQNNEILPDIQIYNQKGKKVKLHKSLQEDKISVISFWATWCKPCLSELRSYSTNYENWKEDLNLEIYTIAVEDPIMMDKARSYAEMHNWDFQQFYDERAQATKTFGFENLPYTLVYAPDKSLIYSSNNYLQGDEQKLEDAVRDYLDGK